MNKVTHHHLACQILNYRSGVRSWQTASVQLSVCHVCLSVSAVPQPAAGGNIIEGMILYSEGQKQGCRI